MNRRDFLGATSSALFASFLKVHTLATPMGSKGKNVPSKKEPLIRSITLQTTTPLHEMKKFYTETIGLMVTHESPKELIIQAGESLIIFEYLPTKDFRPFYHFAFNIPENKIGKAFEWQRKRTPVLHPSPSGPKDEITNFPHWNAHSIFFLDPAGNLLEYIARHDLDNGAAGDFSTNDILYVSEIGFITDDVVETGTNLLHTLHITEYRSGSSGFWPLGDEYGLILMIKQGNVWVSNPGQENKTDLFKTAVRINKSENNSWNLAQFPYRIRG